jgi:heme oxygenase (mycobilin-producing)
VNEMATIRYYRMDAKEGMKEQLGTALAALAQAVRPLEGCQGVLMTAAPDAPDSYLFLETWANQEAHKAAGPQVPSDLLGPVKACLAGPPSACYLEQLLSI